MIAAARALARTSCRLLLCTLVLTLPTAAWASVEAEMLELLVGRDNFDTIKISPTGEYIAATVPLERTTALVVIQLSDMQVTGGINLRDNTHIVDFWWVSDERVMAAVGEKSGRLEMPRLTGELMGVDADGSRRGVLVGPRAGSGDNPMRSRTGGARPEYVAAFMVDPLPDEERHAIVAIQHFLSGEEQLTRAERIDTVTGRRRLLARAPVPRARFRTDLAGEVRFAWGADENRRIRTYHRASGRDEWILINDEAESGYSLYPTGFSADNTMAYLERSEAQGPNSLVAFDTASGTITPALRGEFADPRVLLDPSTGAVIGAMFEEGIPRMAFLDENSDAARLLRTLQASFPGSVVTLDSFTRGGRQSLLRVASDRSPVDYYLYDAQARSADFVVGRRQGVDPQRMAERRPVALEARDGLTLHGYLTVPNGSDGRELPLVVNPHGGPFGPYDRWEFNVEAQLLAAAGYAVLQINFRGSGNYGQGFLAAGYREWGGKMQDDLTDATRWAIAEGIADPERICIYGSSYGAYAALMGVAREPDLYRCAAGNVGVYDMTMMRRQGDIPESRLGRSYLDEVLGSEGLEAISPNHRASDIKVPVFLAAGGEDERAPPDHTRRMEAALRASGTPVEAHIYRSEGHGYFLEENRRDYYQRLLAFFAQHLGPSQARAPTP